MAARPWAPLLVPMAAGTPQSETYSTSRMVFGPPPGFTPESPWGIPLGYPGVPRVEGYHPWGKKTPWGHGFVFWGYDPVFGRFFVFGDPRNGYHPTRGGKHPQTPLRPPSPTVRLEPRVEPGNPGVKTRHGSDMYVVPGSCPEMLLRGFQVFWVFWVVVVGFWRVWQGHPINCALQAATLHQHIGGLRDLDAALWLAPGLWRLQKGNPLE